MLTVIDVFSGGGGGSAASAPASATGVGAGAPPRGGGPVSPSPSADGGESGRGVGGGEGGAGGGDADAFALTPAARFPILTTLALAILARLFDAKDLASALAALRKTAVEARSSIGAPPASLALANVAMMTIGALAGGGVGGQIERALWVETAQAVGEFAGALQSGAAPAPRVSRALALLPVTMRVLRAVDARMLGDADGAGLARCTGASAALRVLGAFCFSRACAHAPTHPPTHPPTHTLPAPPSPLSPQQLRAMRAPPHPQPSSSAPALQFHPLSKPSLLFSPIKRRSSLP